MKAQQIKVVVAGAGYWGKNLIRVFHELGALAGICDSDKTIEKIYLDKYPGTKFFSSFDGVVSNPEINAVAIATPPVTHVELCRRAIDAGKDVFVEKPIALNAAEGKDVVELAEKKHRILMAGHILHYHPAVIELKKLMSRGDLGKILYLYSNRLNIGRIRHEENILWSFAPHDISLMLSITGSMPEKVVSHGGVFLPHVVEDVTLTFFSFPGGVKAHIFVSWLNPFKEQKFIVIGDKKMAVFDDTLRDRKLVLYQHRIAWSDSEVPTIEKCEGEVVTIENKEPLLEEARHFLDCVENRKKPLTDGREALRTLEVLEQAEKSLSLEGK